jgi:hypothetical protein
MHLQMLHKAAYIPKDRRAPSPLLAPTIQTHRITALLLLLLPRVDIIPTQRPPPPLRLARAKHAPETAVFAAPLLRRVQLGRAFDVHMTFGQEGPRVEDAAAGGFARLGVEGFGCFGAFGAWWAGD